MIVTVSPTTLPAFLAVSMSRPTSDPDAGAFPSFTMIEEFGESGVHVTESAGPPVGSTGLPSEPMTRALRPPALPPADLTPGTFATSGSRASEIGGVWPNAPWSNWLTPRTCRSMPLLMSTKSWLNCDRTLSVSTIVPTTNPTPITTAKEVRRNRILWAMSPLRVSRSMAVRLGERRTPRAQLCSTR